MAKKAKRDVLKKKNESRSKSIREKMMKGKLPESMQKVTVMAADKKGLVKGLSKAQEMMEMFQKRDKPKASSDDKHELLKSMSGTVMSDSELEKHSHKNVSGSVMSDAERKKLEEKK